MAFSKLQKSKYPPRLWALVGFPGAGKSTFAARMRSPFVVIDADHRFEEVAHLAAGDIYPVSDVPFEHTDTHAIARRLNENMPGTRVGTIIVDSLTAIIAPKVVAAMTAKAEGEIKNLYAGFKDKALAMRELQDAVTRWGTDALWIYHLNNATDADGNAQTKATVSALELVRLTRSINMQLEIVKGKDGKRDRATDAIGAGAPEVGASRRGIKIVWTRRGRDNVTLWDESGDWQGMPERIEAAAYDGLSQEDMDRKENDAPEIFASPQVAMDWAIERGAFDNINHARNAYDKLKREQQPKNARHMALLWSTDVQRRLAEKQSAAAGEPEEPGEPEEQEEPEF